jgi:hypothetical protein
MPHALDGRAGRRGIGIEEALLSGDALRQVRMRGIDRGIDDCDVYTLAA